MKKILILAGIIVSVTTAHIVFGQSQGSITYEVKVNLHKRLPPDRAEMKSMIPEFRTTRSQLFFTDNESLSRPLIEDEEDDIANGGGPQIKIAQPNNEYYLNQTLGKSISKMEFMGKDYLITDSIKIAPWKLSTETKTIQGYVCKQAFYTDESIPDRKQEITAWYTDQIRSFLGPEKFNTLPGTVLALDINNGERYMVASKIELRPLKKNELKVPASGQKTSQEEFTKLMQEQMKKMGGNGGMIIRH